MAEDNETGTSVSVANTAEAEVNAPRMVTLYSRITGDEIGTYTEAKAIDLQRENPNMTPVKWDLAACEDELFSAIAVVEPVARKLVEEHTRLGYVPEANEASWNLAFGELRRAKMNLELALGATLPTEAEVRDWAAHRTAVGQRDAGYPYELDEEGKQIVVMVEPLSAYPSHVRAVKHQAAIDNYVAETGGA